MNEIKITPEEIGKAADITAGFLCLRAMGAL